MDLFCTINGIEHKIMQGCTFSEEFNETLDSGVIILPEEHKIKDLLAYDDVYIYTKVYKNGNEISFKGYPFNEKDNPRPLFYRHLLVDQFTEEVLTLGDTEEECTYKYKIELMSETKKLETIQLPNISITQPISGDKLSVWELINRFVDMYSPWYRLKSAATWYWEGKYSVDQSLRDTFSNVYSPDFTLNAPNLRTLLSKLFITKDMIPYVKDDVIYGMDISKRGKSFDLKDERQMNKVVGSMTSDSYCDNLRRNYSDALSQDRTCRSVEYIGFRNSSSSLMTIKNMRLEFGMPIYKVNKMYMCYYKKIKVNYSQTISDYSKKPNTDLAHTDPRKDPIAVMADLSTGVKSVYKWRYPSDKTLFTDGTGASIKYEIYNKSYKLTCNSIDFTKWSFVEFAIDSDDTYNPEWEYKKGDYVYLAGLKYQSIMDDKNQGNTPCLYVPLNPIYEEGIFLCKQDITKLVQLNTKRDLLSQDWDDLHKGKIPQNIDDMAKYKFCTVGYDIGSKYITGWGDMYSYPRFWNDNKYTYIQNIASKLDYFYPTGINDPKYIGNCFAPGAVVFSVLPEDFWSIMIAGTNVSDQDTSATEKFFSTVVSPFTNPSLKLKSFFFIVDYEGFYNGSLIHTKDNNRDDITINDNSSESLTLIEQDGIFQHEKVNRFGNKALQIEARYDSFYEKDKNGNLVENLKQVGDVMNSAYEKDVVIYHREYSIWDNCINCVYYGTKNYVLKNYFTSVYARYRTWNLMSYNESVQRSENIKNMILFDLEKSYYEGFSGSLFEDFSGENDYIAKVLSFLNSWTEKNIVGLLEYRVDDRIDSAYILKDNKKYAADMNSFVSKNSMCFNMRMFDNFSQGVFISNAEPFIATSYDPETGEPITSEKWYEKAFKFFNVHDDYSGSKQDWLSVVDSNVTGYAETMGFYVSHKIKNSYLPDDNFSCISENYIKELYSKKIFKIPYINVEDDDMSNKIGIEKNFYKDNKEILDVTMQIENIKKSENLILSPWIMKLSDLMGDKPKFDFDIEKKDQVFGNGISVYASNYYCSGSYSGIYLPSPAIIVKVPKSIAKPDFDKPKSYNCDIFVPLYYAGEIDERTKGLMRNESVLLYSFRIKYIVFDKEINKDIIYNQKNPTHHARAIGEISMVYTDENYINNKTLHPVSYATYCIYLGCVNGKESIAGGMIPKSYQDYDKCGISYDDDFIYLSSVYDNLTDLSFAHKYEMYYKSVQFYPFRYAQMGVFGGEIGKGSQNGPKNNIFNVFQVAKEFSTEASTTYSQVFFYDLPSYFEIESWFGKYLTDCSTIANAGELIGNNLVTKHVIYHKNMFVLFSEKKIEENTLQSDIKYSDFKNLYIDEENKNDKVSDYFSLKYDESGNFGPYIEVNMINAVNNGKTFYNDGKRNLASIQIWYLDDVENGYTKEIDPFGLIQNFKYHPDNCYCHFVFGLNVKQSDYETISGSSSSVKNIKIYLSLISKKDDRVFDQYHKAVGVLSNSAITKKQYSVRAWSPIYQQYESIENLSNAKKISVISRTDYDFLETAVITISRVSGDYIRIFSCGNVDIIYESGKFLLRGKIGGNYSSVEITITDLDYENDKISISFHYRYNETTKKYDAKVFVNGSERESITETDVPYGGIIDLELFGSADASIQANATFKLYSLDTVWVDSYKDPTKRSITRNFVPFGAIGLQDECNVFLSNKDINDGAIITDKDYLNFKLNNKVGKEFTL